MPRLMQVDALPVDDIVVGDRVRPVAPEKVAALVASFEELGVMMNPLQIRKDKKRGFVLVAGGHRLAAAKELGWAEVPVRVWADVTQQWCEIMELDENLSGPGMTPLDTAVFLARRKALYEEKYPETKQGMAGAVGKHSANEPSSFATFSTVVAQVQGVSPRQIQKVIRAGERLCEEEVQWLRLCPEPVRLKDLETLSKIADDAERQNVILAMSSGKCKSAGEAVKKRKAAADGKAPLARDEVLLQRLRDAWSNAPKKARRTFVEWAGDDLTELLGGGDA